jgi:hypothetical protein
MSDMLPTSCFKVCCFDLNVCYLCFNMKRFWNGSIQHTTGHRQNLCLWYTVQLRLDTDFITANNSFIFYKKKITVKKKKKKKTFWWFKFECKKRAHAEKSAPKSLSSPCPNNGPKITHFVSSKWVKIHLYTFYWECKIFIVTPHLKMFM